MPSKTVKTVKRPGGVTAEYVQDEKGNVTRVVKRKDGKVVGKDI